jgi:hypothetical protein
VPTNASLEWEIADLLFRPPGRPSQTPLVWDKSVHYQAGSWRLPPQVVVNIEHHAGERFPRIGFIVTILHLSSGTVVRFYNNRGTAERRCCMNTEAVWLCQVNCPRGTMPG